MSVDSKKYIIVILMLLTCMSAFATHERAGEITYRNIANNKLKYEVTILTYTYRYSPANRDELVIDWGDNTNDTLPLTSREVIGTDMYRNTYVGVKTYSSIGRYLLSFEDPNRNAGILNIPNSVNIPFYTETLLVIPAYGNANNSPILLNPPIDIGCVQTMYIHNPGAYDIDGDSLSYRLTTCRGAMGNEIPDYSIPGNDPDRFWIDPISGTLTWDYPEMQGEYNVAFIIEEWRNGNLIGSVTRDMQIEIIACNNEPPIIEELNDTCVEAGDLLEFTVEAYDPDNDKLTLNAFGGPFILEESPATFIKTFGDSPISSTFSWSTTCEHVRKQPYDVNFIARDTLNTVNLSTLSNIRITVIGKKPENLIASSTGKKIDLNWDPYYCEQISEMLVYRKESSYDYTPDYCETGLPPESEYELIGTVSGAFTSFSDNNNGEGLVHGLNYCYRLVAKFYDGSLSKASDEICVRLKKDVPIITNASIIKTSTNEGEVYIAWSKPTEIDTISYPKPYKYKVYRKSESDQSFTHIESFDNLNDTTFIDSGINTSSELIYYQIELYNIIGGEENYLGVSDIGSTPYLSIEETDNALILSISEKTPWLNYNWVIFRLNPETGTYDSLDMADNPIYRDENLSNGKEYCYYTKSKGEYSIDGILKPLINLSQKACGTPVDNVAPCPPSLKVDTDCDNIENFLSWEESGVDGCLNDVRVFYIYFKDKVEAEYSLIDSVDADSYFEYDHLNLESYIGCYKVVAIDTANNVSENNIELCLDYLECPVYALPNAFTPDGNLINDYFTPLYKATSVIEVDMQIFNRYGRIVYETNDPNINWNGKYNNTQNDCSEGVYFYVCTVHQLTIDGTIKRDLKGAIHLIRK
jgi:gliding motility-associated-like protein